MASIKGKLKMGINRVTEDSRARGTVGGGNLKIYSEDEKVKLDANSIRNSVTVNKAAALTSASNTKRTLNKMDNNIKVKGVSSAYTKVGRKALADVSNIPGNIARNVVHDGSKNLVSVRPGVRTVNALPRKSFTAWL